nr:MAG TPA: hypothetical protein [Caudoviricetes sp.]
MSYLRLRLRYSTLVSASECMVSILSLKNKTTSTND